MLEEIRISNFAIIDQLELTFGRGLNVITGETGAGKSIIVDAVELLLGGKADAAMVRAGADRAVIEGTFSLNHATQALIEPVLERDNLLDENGADVVTLTREIRSNGRSAARVNGVTVNLDVLSEIGDLLVDVHGQSAHLSLLKPSEHINLLDRYADLIDTRAALATVVSRLGDVRSEIKHLLEDEAELKKRADRLRREVEEIDAAELIPGEDDEIRAERNAARQQRAVSETGGRGGHADLRRRHTGGANARARPVDAGRGDFEQAGEYRRRAERGLRPLRRSDRAGRGVGDLAAALRRRGRVQPGALGRTGRTA